MTTYRTGNHWGVTIVREGKRTPEGHIIGADQLVAVVVNGDQELAERICELLNAPTPDVPHTHGAREALATVRRSIDTYPDPVISTAIVQRLLTFAAAELGVDEEADRVTVDMEHVSAADTARVMAIVDAPYQPGLDFSVELDDEDAPPGRSGDYGISGSVLRADDAYRARQVSASPAPLAAEQPTARGTGRVEGTEATSGPDLSRFELDIYFRNNDALLRCAICGNGWDFGSEATLAGLVRRATEHTEVCK